MLICIFLLITAMASGQEMSAPTDSANGFPAGNYTPFGYLDNPYHTLWLNNSGVIRSAPPLGFRFREHHTVLQLAAAVNGRSYHQAADFESAGLHSAYHSKNIFSYNWTIEALEFSATYFLESDRAQGLNCEVKIANHGSAAAMVEVRALLSVPPLDFDHYAAMVLPGGALIRRFAEGPLYLLYSDAENLFRAVSSSPAGVAAFMSDGNRDSLQNREISVEGDFMAAVLSCSLAVSPGAEQAFRFTLIRDAAQAAALETARAALEYFDRRRAELREDDARFWSRCPQLVGDWPEVWKRGLVYDFETLRMNVRRPIGVYKHHWDGMAAAIPRSVLGETALDMLAYSYADPETAQEVIYGLFADALAPNVPCMREDGSVNMVSESGAECGTAPSWCLPSLTIRSIYARTRDRKWAQALYPYLEEFMRWWLENRTHSDGAFFFDNSWESGQDQSSRFRIEQKTGGAGVQHIEPVDLHAAISDFGGLLSQFAGILIPQDTGKWQNVQEKHREMLRKYWTGQGFHDIDRRTGRHTNADFAYLWLPHLFGLATGQQNAVLKQKLRTPEYQSLESWANWPPGFQVVVETAWVLGERVLQAEHVANQMDYLYNWWDRRAWETPGALPRAWGHIDRPANLLEYHPRKWDESFGMIDHSTNPHAPPREHADPIPGVAAEQWRNRDGKPAGMENYGWGATLPIHLIRGVIGYRDLPPGARESGFLLAPSLPSKVLQPGNRLGMRNLHFANVDFEVMYQVKENGRLQTTLTWRSPTPAALTARIEGKKVAGSGWKQTAGSLSYVIENYGTSEIILQN